MAGPVPLQATAAVAESASASSPFLILSSEVCDREDYVFISIYVNLFCADFTSCNPGPKPENIKN